MSSAATRQLGPYEVNPSVQNAAPVAYGLLLDQGLQTLPEFILGEHGDVLGLLPVEPPEHPRIFHKRSITHPEPQVQS